MNTCWNTSVASRPPRNRGRSSPKNRELLGGRRVPLRRAIANERNQLLAELDGVGQGVETLEQQGRNANVVVAQHRFSDVLRCTDQRRGVTRGTGQVGDFHPESFVVDVLVGGHLDQTLATNGRRAAEVAVDRERRVTLTPESLGRLSASFGAFLREFDPPGGLLSDPLCLVPRLLFGPGEDRPKREAVTKSTADLRRGLVDRRHPRGHGLAWFSPERVDVGLFGTHLDGRTGRTGEVERNAHRSQWLDRTERAFVAVELTVEVERSVLAPELTYDGHHFARTPIPGVVRDEVSLTTLIGLVATRDEVDGDAAAARQVIERCGHPGEHDRLDETRPLGHHDFQALRAVEHRARDGPAFWSHRAVADQYAVEIRVLVRSGDGDEIVRIDDRTVEPVNRRAVDEG